MELNNWWTSKNIHTHLHMNNKNKAQMKTNQEILQFEQKLKNFPNVWVRHFKGLLEQILSHFLKQFFIIKKKKKIIILGKFRYIANKKNMEHKLVWQWKKHIHQLKDYDEYITTLIQQSETLQKFGI